MTLKILKGQSNLLAMTLNEKMNPELPPIWMLIFKKEQKTNDNLKVKLDDLSDNSDRYNLFNLVEGIDLTFDFPGDYEYFAYQMPDDETEDPELGLLVESGKARVIAPPVAVPTYVAPITAAIHGPAS